MLKPRLAQFAIVEVSHVGLLEVPIVHLAPVVADRMLRFELDAARLHRVLVASGEGFLRGLRQATTFLQVDSLMDFTRSQALPDALLRRTHIDAHVLAVLGAALLGVVHKTIRRLHVHIENALLTSIRSELLAHGPDLRLAAVEGALVDLLYGEPLILTLLTLEHASITMGADTRGTERTLPVQLAAALRVHRAPVTVAL